jgi:hypothetical protein
MFSVGHTRALLTVWSSLLVFDIFVFSVSELDNHTITVKGFSYFANAIFQSVSVRTVGLNTVDISSLSGGVLVLMVSLMYIVAYPLLFAIRTSRVGGSGDGDDDGVDDGGVDGGGFSAVLMPSSSSFSSSSSSSSSTLSRRRPTLFPSRLSTASLASAHGPFSDDDDDSDGGDGCTRRWLHVVKAPGTYWFGTLVVKAPVVLNACCKGCTL